MPYSDFTVATLACYLHLTPQQVVRLAERGKLPGRKVAGEWRFSKPAIHQWLEQRIGLSDEEELIEVEQSLSNAALPDEPKQICIADLLPREAIAIPLAARTRNSVVTAMVELAATTGWLWDTKAMIEAVLRREQMHTTALAGGVALLHPSQPMHQILAQPFLALGRTTAGVPFGAELLSDVFFLICSTDDRGHLRVLARLSRLLTVPGFLGALRQSGGADEALRLISEYERSL